MPPWRSNPRLMVLSGGYRYHAETATTIATRPMRMLRFRRMLGGRLLVALGGHDAADRGPLELEPHLVGHFQGHGVLREPHHGPVEPARRHDPVTFLDRGEEDLAVLPLLLLRPDDQEVHDREHADHQGQDRHDASAVAAAGGRRRHRVREIHHENQASESAGVSAEPPTDSTPDGNRN